MHLSGPLISGVVAALRLDSDTIAQIKSDKIYRLGSEKSQQANDRIEVDTTGDRDLSTAGRKGGVTSLRVHIYTDADGGYGKQDATINAIRAALDGVRLSFDESGWGGASLFHVRGNQAPSSDKLFHWVDVYRVAEVPCPTTPE